MEIAIIIFSFIIGLGVGICLSVIPGIIAKNRGRRFWPWFFLAFFISWLLAIIIVAILPKVEKGQDDAQPSIVEEQPNEE